MEDIDRLLATFAALLSIARIEAQVRDQEIADVGLADIVADAADLYRPWAEEKGLSLEIDGESGNPQVKGDAQLIFQALVNLLDNAVKYCRSGDRIVLAAKTAGREVHLVVADSGPGIPESQRQAVLQPFVRLSDDLNAPEPDWASIWWPRWPNSIAPACGSATIGPASK